MFDLDRWREIFQSINKNKLRSVMSGFTVAFAILLFTLLFGIVSGLSNSFKVLLQMMLKTQCLYESGKHLNLIKDYKQEEEYN